jgi:cell division protein FtsQ
VSEMVQEHSSLEINRWLRRIAGLRRWSLGLAIAGGGLMVLVVAGHLLVSSAVMALKRIEVKTDGRLERREILQWAGIRPGEPLLTLRLGEVRRRMETHPWVERVWVQRSFPHTLEIRIQERRAVARVMVDKTVYLLDGTGVIFAPSDTALLGGSFTLVGLREADLKRRPEACQRVLQEALALLCLLRDRPDWRVREVGVDPDRGLRLVLEDGPGDIHLGFGDLNQRMERLEKILQHLARDGRLRQAHWIDLRYPRRAAVKFKG